MQSLKRRPHGIIVGLIITALLSGSAQGQPVLYVDVSASGVDDGSTWTDAYVDLQDALEHARQVSSVDEIWVAAGTYTPADPGGDREASFELIDGVAIYGGFASGETSLDQCDPTAHVTILSGNLSPNGSDCCVAHAQTGCEDLGCEQAVCKGEPSCCETGWGAQCPERARWVCGDLCDNQLNSYHVLIGSGNDSTAVLDGLTITSGYADVLGPGHNAFGGGLYIEAGSPTIRGCIFQGNFATIGAAVAVRFGGSASTPTFVNCTFTGNGGSSDGTVRIDDSDATFENCAFRDNQGGAVRMEDSNSTFEGCVFTGNTYSAAAAVKIDSGASHSAFNNCTFIGNRSRSESGGAISMGALADATLNNCTFIGNRSGGRGGAIRIDDSTLNCTNCVFVGNFTDDQEGGAIANTGDAASCTLTNCLFTGNRSGLRGGGAIYNSEAPATLINCTLAQNHAAHAGGALSSEFGSQVILVSCIVWNNTAGVPATAQFATGKASTLVVDYSDVEGGFAAGFRNIDQDPLFVSPGHWDDNNTPEDRSDDVWVAGDYRLVLDSPCVDTGRNASVDSSVDLDGNPRVINGVVDMGPYELQAICGNGECAEGIDACNCPEDCGEPDTVEVAGSTCDDGEDNDCDGRIDCFDADCGALPECIGLCGNTICEDGEDLCGCPDDCGPVDGNELSDVTCGDGVDNDCDELIDCDDPDCGADAECLARYQCERFRFTASDVATGHQFGAAVATDGEYAVVGADHRGGGGAIIDAGAAYVYQRHGDGWLEVAKLVGADDPDDRDRFGGAVALSGDRIAVGAAYQNDIGRVYVYRHAGSDWELEAELTASDATHEDEFGSAVSLSGDYLAIGAREAGCNGGATLCGAAYVFERFGTDWIEVAKLTPSDRGSGDTLGTSISISGDVVVVGAPHPLGAEPGAAYVFRRQGAAWIEETKLVASDATDDADFGTSVHTTGARILVGANDADGVEARTGAAYVFQWDGGDWIEEVKLTASDEFIDEFGSSVVIAGDMIVVGADSHSWAYLFRRDDNGWIEQAKYSAADHVDGDDFGMAVSMSGGVLLVGAPSRVHFSSRGAVYSFRVTGEPDCNLNTIYDACELDCDGNELPDDCDIDENSDAPGGPFFCTEDCDPDCNNDGVPDSCQLFFNDCNFNGVPDECDLANCLPDNPACDDCDGNGRLDSCDILDCRPGRRSCEDCDDNGIMDSCEATGGAARGDAVSSFLNPAVADGFIEPSDQDALTSKAAGGDAPFGACCDPDFGFCDTSTEAFCLARSRIYQGNGSGCCEASCFDRSSVGAVHTVTVDKIGGVSAGRWSDGSLCRWVVDDVTFAKDVVITGLSWYTAEFGTSTWDGTADIIVLLADGPDGSPGTIAREFNAPASFENTGEQILINLLPFIYMRYEIDHTTAPGFGGIELPAGTYWIGMRPVQNLPISGFNLRAASNLSCPEGGDVYVLYEDYPLCETSADCPNGEPCESGFCTCAEASCDSTGAWLTAESVFGVSFDVAFSVQAAARCDVAGDCDDGDPCTVEQCDNPPNGVCDYFFECEDPVVYVDDDAPAGGDGLSWETAFDDLQQAMSAAPVLGRDEIWVAGGTYRPTLLFSNNPRSATFQLMSGMSIYGGFTGHESDLGERDLTQPGNESILSGDHLDNDSGDLDDPSRDENSYHVVTGNFVDETGLLDGFTITGGNANAGGEDFDNWIGGGLVIERGSPRISNCLFKNNRAWSEGGGAFCLRGSPQFIHCSFEGNSAVGFVITEGGGLWTFQDTVIQDCRFVGNTATWGGGLSHDRNAYIANCAFVGNSASELGGAIYGETAATLVNCLFRENVAVYGGAVYLTEIWRGSMINCTLWGNTATECGGGIYKQGSFNGEPSTAVPTLTNCVLWGNSDAGGTDYSAQFTAVDGAAEINYSCVQGRWAGRGRNNISGNPFFVDAGGGDLRLRSGSPCIDAGDSTVMPTDFADLDGDGDTGEIAPVDLDGNPRIVDRLSRANTGVDAPLLGAVDMGAYEAGDCNGNGTPDEDDIAAGSSDDCNANNIPDECDTDCNGNGVPDECDITSGSATDGPADHCPANGILDECEPDCNANGVPDSCDIAHLKFVRAPDLPISDTLPPTVDSILITSSGVVRDVDVEVDISHTWIGDLRITLGHNDTSVVLIDRSCGSERDLRNTIFDDEATAAMVCISPNSGRFTPAEPLSAFDGMDVSGEWVLTVSDAVDLDNGTLHAWTLLLATDDTSPDCTGNGVPDECEPDCNGNSIADSCDIASGFSSDCTGNGVPDECEPDCNDNGVPDSCDVAGRISMSSAEMYGIDFGPKIFTIPSAPLATRDVKLSFAGAGLFIDPNVYVDVDINGVAVGRVFDCGGFCEFTSDALIVSAETFNDAVAGGNAVIHMVPSLNPAGFCDIDGGSYIAVDVLYDAAGSSADCNRNEVPDECEPDTDGNGLPDDCCVLSSECVDSDPCTFDLCAANVCSNRPGVHGDVAGSGGTCGSDGQVNLTDILAVLDGFANSFANGCELPNIDIASLSDACAPDGLIDLSDILAVLDAFQGVDRCCGSQR